MTAGSELDALKHDIERAVATSAELATTVAQLEKRLADCELSLNTFDPGHSSEYWLRYPSAADEVTP